MEYFFLVGWFCLDVNTPFENEDKCVRMASQAYYKTKYSCEYMRDLSYKRLLEVGGVKASLHCIPTRLIQEYLD